MTGENVLCISESRSFISLISSICNSRAARLVFSSYENGKNAILKECPDMIILDIDSMDMEDYLTHLLPKYSLPVIVCSSLKNTKFKMLQAGAIDVIDKPTTSDCNEFCFVLGKSVERIKVMRKNGFGKNHTQNVTGIIAIGGSTGSTDALPIILRGLRRNVPPILVTLHMPEKYTEIYAKQLSKNSVHDIYEAKDGMRLHSGQVIIAQGNKHLRLFKDKQSYFITSESGIKVSGHCPSVDVLFESVAYAAKADAIGVILTGMGKDGQKGMLEMKRMGAYNIGQGKESCVVYGMPKEAYDAGALDIQRELTEIPKAITQKLDERIIQEAK